MELEKSTMVTISSAHVPGDKRDSSVIDPVAKLYLDKHCMSYREGWIINLHSQEYMAPWLRAVIKELDLEGVDYLRLDADGPMIPGLETYEW